MSKAITLCAIAIVVIGCSSKETGGDVGASLGTVSSAFSFGNCAVAHGHRCADMTFSDAQSGGTFYLTDFVGGAMACQGYRPADGTWAYVADSQRFGCGAKLKVEANGKSCIAVVADCGPNAGVERAAADPVGCSSHFPVLDASPLIARYLFNTSSAGWSDHFKVNVTRVDPSTPEGCGDVSSVPTGTSGTCKTDNDCNNGTPGEGVVCKSLACRDGCRTGADCPSGSTCSASGAGATGTCSTKATTLGTPCTQDSDCTGGLAGSGRVCSRVIHKCIVGCHGSQDCASPAVCDMSGPTWRCVTRHTIGDPCTSDYDCSGGLKGTQRICDDTAKVCTDACRTDADCTTIERCNSMHQCELRPDGPDAGDDGGTGVSASCVLTYPAVSIQGKAAPAEFVQAYSNRGCGVAPACVLDVTNLVDARTGKRLSYNHVSLSAHFTLREMTYQSVQSSPYVFVDPKTIEELEATRQAYGRPMIVNSGYRSPIHQRDICNAMCGRDSCPGRCARCSDHMGGRAIDLVHSAPKCDQAKPSCAPGQFHLIYNEPYGGDHLHIDTGSGNPVCAYKGITCN